MPETTLDPLAVRCRACVAPPGEPCIGTTSNLPRERPHRLRPLAAAPRLVHCPDCRGSGWRDTGRPLLVDLVECPVCGAAPHVRCTEGGRVRDDLHEVRRRAARAGLEPCGTCEAVGWVPAGEPEPTALRPDAPEKLQPEDVPAELVTAFMASANEAYGYGMDDYDARHILAAVLPGTYRWWFTQAFGTREEIAAREADAAKRTPDDTVRLCETARPGEHEQRVRAQVAAEIEDARGPRPRGSALPDFAGAAYDHAARIARGEPMKPTEVPDEQHATDLAAHQAELRRCLTEVTEVMEGRPATMVRDAVWARVRPALHEIERQVREQVAVEIEAEDRDPSSEYERGLNVAARIARGES
ncbi:zinc finger domain-containing protein [Actinomadura madurae]|uniref:zinc finger domain-containing protein n=1 Tax=Actinomadura madurae TaxID=1993 RepID=UPI0020D23E5A|nr:hypothetical protein [Actinomadura madurae]MCP9947216.1 hypothetical protein [Actinomadura madurae]MCP9963981.1 hypothetical protein [Actinomadura madurae]MCP9976456.1 hypothetical protein [Actinomadura madurae]MCQ0012051.1 hypothetical protein [Actinomadura madurae]MCQ0012649.1 hypothetical protein [Actinomadura madurae]